MQSNWLKNNFKIWSILIAIIFFGMVNQASAQIGDALVNFSQAGSGVANISINVPGGEKISGIDIEVISSDVSLTKIGPVTCADKSKTFSDIINQASGKKARIVSVLFEKSVDLCAKLIIPLQYSGNAQGTISLNKSASQISGTGANLLYKINANTLQLGEWDGPFEPLPPDGEPIVSIPPSQQNGDINLRFAPSNLQIPVGGSGTQFLQLRSSSGDKKISAWDIELEYTGGRVKILSVGGKTNEFDSGEQLDSADEKCTVLDKKINASKTGVRFSYTCLLPDEELPSAVRIPIRLSGALAGTSNVIIKGVEIVGNLNENYTVGRGTGSVTVGGDRTVPDPDEPDSGAGASVNVNMSFRLQGVPTRPQKPRPVKMKIGFGDGGMAKPKYVTGTFNFDENGLLRGNVGTSLPSLQNLKVLAKCGHCIQKKICDLNPTESVGGIYVCDKGKIPFRSGNNTLDFSNILLLVGDLGEQDGVTNSLDVALVRNNFGKSDEASLALADLNFDGEVNTQDYALIIRALSIKRDEP